MEIKTLRQETGLSQSQFANKYQIPIRTLQQWEQGKSNPPIYFTNLLQDKCKILDNAKYLINYSDIYKIVIDKPFLNCNMVRPIQQRKVKELINEIATHNEVIKIIIFGSSVTRACKIDSDIDIYVEVIKDIKLINKSFDFEFDLWTNFTVDQHLYKEIISKGVVVYGQD